MIAEQAPICPSCNKNKCQSRGAKKDGRIEYRLWREAVFKRDDWTCVWCFKRGGDLEADHIKSFANHPELRFVLDNGRTLCIPCHKKTDTYGRNAETSASYQKIQSEPE